MLRLALPAMAALAADPLLSLVDTALVGRLGTDALAALGICTAIFTTIFFGFNFLTYGTTAAVARFRGAGDLDAAGRYAMQALWLAVALGALTCVALVAAAGPIVAAMGAREGVVEPAMTYLRVRAFGAIPLLVSQVGHGLFRGMKDTSTPLKVSLAVNVVNGVLSWFLIYPLRMGVAGAAIGTVVAEVCAAGTLLVLARSRVRPTSLRVDLRAMRSVVTVSWDLFLRTAALLGGLLVTTAVAARMGTVVVAAHQIARELWTMLALVLDGFAIAGQALIATSLGAGDTMRARADARTLVRWGLGSGVLIAVGYLALSGVLPRVFTGDPAVLRSVSQVWLVVALLQPVGGIVFVLDGVLMGAGDFRFLLLSTAAASLLALVPVALLALAFGWGLPGVWAAMVAMMMFRLVATVWRLRQGGWVTAARAAAHV